MAYAPPALRRRSRRRRTLAIVLIVATLLGVVALAVRYRTDRRVAVDYLDSVKDIIDEETLLATSVGEVFRSIGSLERQDIVERLTIAAATSQGLREELAGIALTGSITEVHGFLTVAVASWDDAMATMEAAVVEVLDGADAPTGDAMLETAFDLLRVGDRAYFGFREAVTRLDPELLGQAFSGLEFVGGERAGLYDAEILAGRLRGILKLEGDHDISLVGTIDPEPLIETGSIPIVPNAERFIVSLVVSNGGNLQEESILVGLEGTPPGGVEEEAISLQQLIPFLAPDSSTTVTFDLSDAVTPGVIYELRATVSIAEDDTPDNNVWELVFVRNAE